MNTKFLILLFISTMIAQTSYGQSMNGFLPSSIMRPKGPRKPPAVTSRVQNTDAGSFENKSIDLTYKPKESNFFFSTAFSESKIGDQELTLEDGTEVKNRLKDLQFRTSYDFKDKSKGDWTASFGFGSSSDQLFEKSKDNTTTLSVVTARPGKKGRWIFGLFYNNNLNFDFLVLPIIAYSYAPSKNFSLIAGAPFLTIRWGSYIGTNLFAFGSPFGSRVQISHSIFGPFAILAGYNWKVENYQHVNRLEDEDQFFIQTNNVYFGARLPILKGVMLNLNVGYRYDSRYFQADGLFDTDDKTVFALEDSSYIQTNISFRF